MTIRIRLGNIKVLDRISSSQRRNIYKNYGQPVFNISPNVKIIYWALRYSYWTILHSRYSPTHINVKHGSYLTLCYIMNTISPFGGFWCPLCRIQGYQSVSKEEDLITVETHGHYQKQLTTTSYMSHNVKNVSWGGGGGPGPSIITLPILLHGYHLSSISMYDTRKQSDKTLNFKSQIWIFGGFWVWFYWMFYDHFSARSHLAKLSLEGSGGCCARTPRGTKLSVQEYLIIEHTGLCITRN